MRVVGLISGGKDSIYNLMHCVAAGHNVIALANLHPHPTASNELDSFMYQTVGHEGVSLVAAAMGLPLYRQRTLGKSACKTVQYRPTENDEVEDLFTLLSQVKKETNCEGVSVGAIASDYQRCRVESVCTRLNLTSLAYLWKQDQAQLLTDMIQAQITAILVKVASMGLEPDKHLGMPLSTLQPIVTQLNQKYGVNVCGEGGEYESFVLDCPLFHQKIIVENTEVIKDSHGNIGASGHLVIKSARLEPKFGTQTESDTWSSRLINTCTLTPSPFEYEQEHRLPHHLTEEMNKTTPLTESKCGGWQYETATAGTISEALESTIASLKSNNLTPDDIVFVNLWIMRMEDFAEINKEYVKKLPNVSPARACVAISHPDDELVTVEVIASSGADSCRQSVHVQSISHWAPANIGPYSQAVKINGTIFVAGQIPLIPGSMALLQGPIEEQVYLSLRHISRILEECKSNLSEVVLAVVYVVNPDHVLLATEAVKGLAKNIMVTGVVVSQLPRLADVEVVVLAETSSTTVERRISVKEAIVGDMSCTSTTYASPSLSGFVCHVRNGPVIDEDAIKKVMEFCGSQRDKCVFLRVLYNHTLLPDQDFSKAIRKNGSLGCAVPVVQNENQEDVLTIIGFMGQSPAPS